MLLCNTMDGTRSAVALRPTVPTARNVAWNVINHNRLWNPRSTNSQISGGILVLTDINAGTVQDGTARQWVRALLPQIHLYQHLQCHWKKKKQIFFSVNSPEVIRKNSLPDITGPFLTFSTSNGVRSLSVDLMLSLAWWAFCHYKTKIAAAGSTDFSVLQIFIWRISGKDCLTRVIQSLVA